MVIQGQNEGIIKNIRSKKHHGIPPLKTGGNPMYFMESYPPFRMQTQTHHGSQHLPLQGSGPVTLRRIQENLARHAPRTLADSSELAHAAVAMILRAVDATGEPEILIIRRAEHPQDPWSGHLGFPGGRVEPQDRSPEHTAQRETREELGVALDSCAKLLGRLSELRARARSRHIPLSIYPFVYELIEPVVLQLNGEVVETHWVPLHFFLDPANREPMPHPHDPERIVSSYPVGNRTIWGLSLAMLDELLFEVSTGG